MNERKNEWMKCLNEFIKLSSISPNMSSDIKSLEVIKYVSK